MMIDLERLKKATTYAFEVMGALFVFVLVLSFFLENYNWILFGSENSIREIFLAIFCINIVIKYCQDK